MERSLIRSRLDSCHPPPDGQRDAERSYVQTGTDEAAAHTLELCLYSFFINIINSMFVYYVCHELLVNL